MEAHPELRPHTIFEVHPPADSFAAGVVKDGLVAFHGTSLDCVHGILHAGLLSLSGTSLERTGSAFGSGIYLSLDPCTAFSFSQPGTGWANSMLGQSLRCLLMCEVAPVRGEEFFFPFKSNQTIVGYVILKNIGSGVIVMLTIFRGSLNRCIAETDVSQ